MAEEIKFTKNGQWSLIKMSSYGPKGADLYDLHVNQERKANNTGDQVADAGRNVNVKAWTSAKQGTAKQQAAKIAKEQKILNAKQPVRSEISPEEKAKIEARFNLT